jgi:hypothetical protein
MNFTVTWLAARTGFQVFSLELVQNKIGKERNDEKGRKTNKDKGKVIHRRDKGKK